MIVEESIPTAYDDDGTLMMAYCTPFTLLALFGLLFKPIILSSYRFTSTSLVKAVGTFLSEDPNMHILNFLQICEAQ